MARSFSIIVACDVDGGIGIENRIPWKISRDLGMFRRLTTFGSKMSQTLPEVENVVIMGRNTWESLPDKYRPLPNRTNIVVTSRETGAPVQASSFQEALDKAYALGSLQVFVIGGSQLYEEAVGHPDLTRVYVTKVLSKYKCDRFFPLNSLAGMPITRKSEILVDEGFTFVFQEFSVPSKVGA